MTMKWWVVFIFILADIASLAQSKMIGQDSIKESRDSSSLQAQLSMRDLNMIDSISTGLTFRIDSLQRHGSVAASERSELDRLNRKLTAHLQIHSLPSGHKTPSIAKEKHLEDSMSQAVTKRAAALRQKMSKRRSKLDSAGYASHLKISSPGLPGGLKPAIPSLPSRVTSQISETSLSSVTAGDGTKIADLSSGTLQNLENKVTLSEKMPALPSGKIPVVGTDINAAAQSAENLEKKIIPEETNLTQLKNADTGALETQAENGIERGATNNSNLTGLKTESGKLKIEEAQVNQADQLASAANKDDVVKEGEQFSKRALKNPFAGQETRLTSGVTRLDKLKQKYHTVEDSRHLPKIPPNEMKGKKFGDRFIPGIWFQPLRSDHKSFELSAYTVYRFTGRLRIGMGGGERFIFSQTHGWSLRTAHAESIRVIADMRTVKTWYFHIEGEKTHFSPAGRTIFHLPGDPALKPWNTRLNTGVLRPYSISRRISGQAQVLYNTLDFRNFPQSRNTSIRVGFEYKIGHFKKKNKNAR